jgi:hypothetical protein
MDPLYRSVALSDHVCNCPESESPYLGNQKT